MKIFGQELMADVAAPAEVLSDPERIREALRAGADALGCEVLTEHHQLFEPSGVTAVVIIGESHLLASTYEELGLVAIGIQTCSGVMDLVEGLAAICRVLGSEEVRSLVVLRRLDSPLQVVLQREAVRVRDGHLQLTGAEAGFSASTAMR